MALAGTLLASTRLNSLKLATTNITTQLSYRHSVRLFSSVLPRVRPVPTNNAFIVPPYSRSYWWSKSKSSLPSSPPEIPTSPEQSATETLQQSILIEDVATEPVSTSSAVAPEPVMTDGPVGTLIDIPDVVPLTGPPPLNFGDFDELGLLSWTPAGLVRWTVEIIQVTTGMPWFHTIVAATMLWRIVLFPMSIASLRNSARMLPMTNRLLAIKNEMAALQKQGDKLAMQRAALKQQKVYADAGVSMGSLFLGPLVQVPVTLGLFFGIKKICQLPVEQLKNSGLDILPDLTVADPYFILPAIAALAINLQISVGVKEMNLTERPAMGHFMNLLRVFSVAGIYFMGDLPSGLMVSLITGVTATTLQSLALQYLPFRRSLDIPIVPPQYQGRLPSFVESLEFVIETLKEKRAEANREAMRQRKRR